MNLIVTLENSAGMSFGGRRVSRDIAVSEDIMELCKGNILYIYEKSDILFENVKNKNAKINVVSGLEDIACKEDSYYFAEKNIEKSLEAEIDKIVIYRWNRDYPSDEKFEFPLDEFGLQSVNEFKGNSHDKITREIYTRKS